MALCQIQMVCDEWRDGQKKKLYGLQDGKTSDVTSELSEPF